MPAWNGLTRPRAARSRHQGRAFVDRHRQVLRFWSRFTRAFRAHFCLWLRSSAGKTSTGTKRGAEGFDRDSLFLRHRGLNGSKSPRCPEGAEQCR